MPQSRTRTSRQATRAKYRKPRRRRGGSMGWNVAIAAVVIVGVVAVVLTRSGSESSAGSGPPFAPNQAEGQAQSHWHTAFDVNICGEWLGAVPEFHEPVGSPAGTTPAGIHSHGDGLIHTHPNFQSEAGKNATVGKFADFADITLSSDSIDAWTGPASQPDQTSWSNGDRCTFGEYEGQKGEVVWAVDGTPKTGDPSDYHQQDGETIAIGFLPKGAELDFPPDACAAFANISDQNTPAAVSERSPCLDESTTTTTAPATSTTAAP